MSILVTVLMVIVALIIVINELVTLRRMRLEDARIAEIVERSIREMNEAADTLESLVPERNEKKGKDDGRERKEGIDPE